MNGGIVELDALSDTDRTGAEHDNGPVPGVDALDELLGLVLTVIGRIEVRCLGGKLGSAGIDHFINSMERLFNGLACELFDDLIGEAHFLGLMIQLKGGIACFKLILELNKIQQLIGEPLVDLGDVKDLLGGNAAAESLIHDEESFVVAVMELLSDLVIRKAEQLGRTEAVMTDLGTSYSLHHSLLEGRTDRHYLAGSLHLSTQLTLSINKFIERPLGQLDNDIVDRGLKAGIGLACYGIDYLIESVADSDLCCDLCDRIACRLGGKRRGT